jgi:pimeloyl-ACP methyl ester carboxylesterase
MGNQIIINNLLISYNKVGNGEKALLFLHGWRSEASVWRGVVGGSGQWAVGRSVYAIDLPGFGGSEIPKQPMTVGDYADMVEQFINKLELKDIIIVGHSFGGRVGIKLAAKYPQTISKLVLVDAAGFAMDGKKKSLMNSAAKIAKPFFKPNFMQGLRKKIYQTIGAEDYVVTPQLQQTFINVTSEDLTSDMKNIKCPTLIITGAGDLDTPVEFGERMNSLILNSKFLILPNAGHFSFLDQPDKFVKYLNEFIQNN